MDGNVTPRAWYASPSLQHANGKPNLVAITLLADILFWYRPFEVRIEGAGTGTEYRQKFAADKLRMHYKSWGDGFGFTQRQVEDAMAFLREKGLVTVETRAVATAVGIIPNCAFIEPVFDKLRLVTHPPDDPGYLPRPPAPYPFPR